MLCQYSHISRNPGDGSAARDQNGPADHITLATSAFTVEASAETSISQRARTDFNRNLICAVCASERDSTPKSEVIGSLRELWGDDGIIHEHRSHLFVVKKGCHDNTPVGHHCGSVACEESHSSDCSKALRDTSSVQEVTESSQVCAHSYA